MAIIDTEDYEKIRYYRWHAKKWGIGIGVCAHIPNKEVNGNRGFVRMHQVLLPKIEGLMVDHINGNPLDNRKSNLRYATAQQNMFNRGVTRGRKLPKGVYRNPNTGNYQAGIRVNRKFISLGTYKTVDEAKQARIKAEIKYFGDYKRR